MQLIKVLSISILIIQCFVQSVSESEERIEYLCVNKNLSSKCYCHEKVDILYSLLYVVDCSRLDFEVSPNQNVLPKQITNLDMSHNKITQLKNDTKLNCSTLLYLDYSYNNICNISNDYFDNLTNLISLNLSNNYLNKLNNIQINLDLKILNLASNNIIYIPYNFFNNLQVLQQLDLSGNNLGRYFFELKSQILPPYLTALKLNAINLTNITNVTFSNLPLIQVFQIVDNPIKEMFILPFKRLEYLDISGINITEINKKHLNFTYLKEFKMTQMRHLKTIGDLTFGNLGNLEVLTIENCSQLTDVSSLAFGFLNEMTVKDFKLKNISLAKNNISYLSGDFELLFVNVDEVDIGGNPWICGCELAWMTRLKNVTNVNYTRCSLPPHLKSKILPTLKHEEFTCLKNRNIDIPALLPTHRWLFPLIGALSVLVLILVGALMYLGPFGPTLSWTPMSLGPDSPYNRITVEPIDETTRNL